MQRDRNIATRLATPQDVPTLVALWWRFMQDERNAVPEVDASAALSNWTDRLRSQIAKSRVAVVEIDAIPVGFAGFIDSSERQWAPESVAYVVDICTVPEAKASSAAKLLFEHLFRDATRGHTEVWTNTSVHNRRVQVLLTRAGFTPLEDFEIPGLKEQLYFRRGRETA